MAVLTYLRCIIESIDNFELIDITLQYLLAVPETPQKEKTPVRPTTLAMRRKSQTLISNLAQGQERPLPELFNLVDLVITSLRSRNQQTVTATLRLVSVILQSQHEYGVSSIVKVLPADGEPPMRTLFAHDQDASYLFTLAEHLMFDNHLRETYEAHLQDARMLLESHCCSTRLLALPGSDKLTEHSIKGSAPDNGAGRVQPHYIKVEDPLMKRLLKILEEFLTNDVGTNLSLTQVFSTLASCGYTRLEPWLLGDPLSSALPTEKRVASENGLEAAEQDKVIVSGPLDVRGNDETGTVEHTTRPSTNRSDNMSQHSPPVVTALGSIVKQIEVFRNDIEGFDTYLAERQSILKVEDQNDGAFENLLPSGRSKKSPAGTSPAIRGVTQAASIPDRLSPELSPPNASKSHSPRGRQLDSPFPSPSLTGRFNNLRLSPKRSKSGARVISPSPLRKNSIPSTPLGQLDAPREPSDILNQKIMITTKADTGRARTPDMESSDTGSVRSGSVVPEAEPSENSKEVTLSHILTNVIILQEFILELAAVVQVRASLFGEVQFI